MAFSRLKGDLIARVSAGFQNLAFVFQKLEKDGDEDILVGSLFPENTPLKVRLSKTRTWREREALADTFADIKPGSAIVLYEADIADGVAEVRRVMPVTKTPSDPGKMVSGVFARVGEPVLKGDDWVQAVQVIHAQEAKLCDTRENTIDAIMSALTRGEIGSPGFAIRAVDEEGVAIAVRFQRLWNTEKMVLADAKDSLDAFLETEVMIQGLSQKVLGKEFLDILEAQEAVQWEVIPITTFNMRGEQVKAAGEGHGRNRAAPYRYNFARPDTGTGFVPSVVAIDKTAGYYCKDAIPVTGGIAPVSLPYIPSSNLQPSPEGVMAPKAEPAAVEPKAAPEVAETPAPKRAKASRKSSSKEEQAPAVEAAPEPDKEEAATVVEEPTVDEAAAEPVAEAGETSAVDAEEQEAVDADAAIANQPEAVELSEEESAALAEAFGGEGHDGDFSVDLGDLGAELDGLHLEPLTELGEEPLIAPAAAM